MKKLKRFLATFMVTFLVVCFVGTSDVAAASDDGKPVAEVMIGSDGINLLPTVPYARLAVTVSSPDGTVIRKTFDAGTTPYIGLNDLKECPNGVYTYELRVSPFTDPRVRSSKEFSAAGKHIQQRKALTQTGHFSVKGGAIITASGTAESPARPLDILHYDDVIITGSLCVGFDCQDGESFGFDTIILKEHNLRIYFNDTSYTASYPTNNWRITINDSTNGGASYFSVDDVDDGTSIFKIEAGAPSNSLYVEDYGRVGLGTSTPVVELHIKDSDTPTLRLEQDSSGGWTAQTFDVAGNESNFFIRDATNGSKLPFRIQPSTPSSTLCLKSDGNVGIGTWSPSEPLELEVTGDNADFIAERTSGATALFGAGASIVYMGSQSNHALRFYVHNDWVMRLNTDGTVDMSDGGGYDGTSWFGSSSRELKENIQSLTTDEAIGALKGLNPVKFNLIKHKEEEHVGFIAEEVPELVAKKGRKAISPMDVVAVLTKVLQEQQKSLQEQQKTISELNARIAELESK